MSFLQRLIFALVFFICTANAQEHNSETGAEILLPFKQELQQALLGGLADGPEQVIDVCKLEAPEIATSLSQNGILLGRASDRLRNPLNTTPEWAAPILESYTNNPENREPQHVSLSENRTGYVEPILIQPVCLACHGTELSQSISTKLNLAYPADRATGYQTGDLRGIFWVEFVE